MKKSKVGGFSNVETNNEYEYDSFGREIVDHEFSAGNVTSTLFNKVYNAEGQLSELYIKLNNNNKYLWKRYFYNSNKELFKEEAMDEKGETMYTYFYEYNHELHKKTTYLENTRGRTVELEEYYNNLQQLIRKRYWLSNWSFAPFKVITTYSYNPDQTLFESKQTIDGRRVEWIRHYYFR